jgi:hypothetical protein
MVRLTNTVATRSYAPGERVTAIYVGMYKRLEVVSLTFILVHDDGGGRYRRVGVFTLSKIDLQSMADWYKNPAKSFTSFLQDLVGGPEWHQETLRLV